MDAAVPLALAGMLLLSGPLGLVTATETALERANGVRIQAAAARGDARAERIAGKIQQQRTFLGPLTVARVLCSAATVALAAWIGAREFSPFAGVMVGALIGGLYVAIIQMTFGLLAARSPERAALQLSTVPRPVGLIFGVPSFLLSLPARLIARSLSLVAGESRDDILSLMEREEASGGVEEQEQRMIRGVIRLEAKAAREIMIPRIDIVAAEAGDSIEAAAQLVAEHGYSRIPVYRERIDNIEGIVYAKDLLRAISTGAGGTLVDLMRKPEFVPDSKRLDELLTHMRDSRNHMAIVSDEYGGVAGLVTFEDLIEEIVGEVEDEYDRTSPLQEKVGEGEYILDARAATDVLKELFDLEVDSEDFETIGGFVMHQLGRLPAVGDHVVARGLDLRVVQMTGRRIRRLRVGRSSGPNDGDGTRARAAV